MSDLSQRMRAEAVSLAEHAAATASEAAKALKLNPATVAYHLTGLRKK